MCLGGVFVYTVARIFSSPGPYEVERRPSGSSRQAFRSCRGTHITTLYVATFLGDCGYIVGVGGHHKFDYVSPVCIISMSRVKSCNVVDGLQCLACGADRFRSGADDIYTCYLCGPVSLSETVPGGVLNNS